MRKLRLSYTCRVGLGSEIMGTITHSKPALKGQEGRSVSAVVQVICKPDCLLLKGVKMGNEVGNKTLTFGCKPLVLLGLPFYNR